MSDDLRLNRLSRYSKQSDRLILEEHSAGCGGILLRWRDPNEGEPIRFHVVVAGEATLFVDGNELESPRVVLARGDHLLAIRLNREAEQPRLMAATAYRDIASETRGYDVVMPGLTTGQPGWRIQPGVSDLDSSEWTQGDFDDASWSIPEETNVPGQGYDEFWRFRMLVDSGVKAVSLPDTDEVWIRKRFSVGTYE